MLPPQRKRARENLRADILATLADICLGILGLVAVLLAFGILWVTTP
jgi:hypothetical protein